MNEERKKYEVIGTVTIGTDEYRDLLEDKFQAQKDRDYYSSKYWEEYKKVGELEKKIKSLQTQNDQYAKFIAENDEKDKLELWLVKTIRSEL